jgi:succinylglutamate desuccinylase
MNVTEWKSLPAGFLECDASEIIRFSEQPILLHLTGRKTQPLVLSILLHGNEDTGWRALQMVLRKYRQTELPRSLTVFIGNITAAHERVRRLNTQPDYNRIWPGTLLAGLPEAELAASVVQRMQALKPFAFIDIHNNTGKNPFYACVTEVNAQNLYLARLFSRTVVYFRTPVGTAAGAMNALCPSITVECGKAGSTAGDEQAAQLIEAALHLDHFPVSDHTSDDVEVYHTVATVKIAPEASFRFSSGTGDIVFQQNFEDWNFCELPAGTVLAEQTGNSPLLQISDESGADAHAEFIDLTEGKLRLRRSVMPAMITMNQQVIRQDCLCYLMERYEQTTRA